MSNKTAHAQQWSAMIRREADQDGTTAIIDAINRLNAARQVNSAAVALACTEILAQIIVKTGPEFAPDIRSGIIALIDGFATEVAVGNGL